MVHIAVMHSIVDDWASIGGVEEDNQSGTGQRLEIHSLIQEHNMLRMSLARTGQGHHIIPGHDIAARFDFLQSYRTLPCICGQGGLLVGIEE